MGIFGLIFNFLRKCKCMSVVAFMSLWSISNALKRDEWSTVCYLLGHGDYKVLF